MRKIELAIASAVVSSVLCHALADCWVDENEWNSGVTGTWKEPVAYSGGWVDIEDGNEFALGQSAESPVSTVFATLSFDGPSTEEPEDDDVAAVRLGVNSEGELEFQLLAGYASGARWVGVSTPWTAPQADTEYTFRFVMDRRDGVYTYSACVAVWGYYQQLSTAEGVCDFPLANSGEQVKSVALSGDGSFCSIYAESDTECDDGFTVDWGGRYANVWGQGAPSDGELARIKSWTAANALPRSGINSELGAAAYLFGMDYIPSAVPTLDATRIEKSGDSWQVTVSAMESGNAVPLGGGVNGRLTLRTSSVLVGAPDSWALQPYSADNISHPGDGTAVVKVCDSDSRFFVATLVR